MKPVSIVVLVLAGVVASCGSSEIGLMLVLASHLNGTLVDKDHRPVPNVRVERTWEWAWNGKTGSDISTTDGQGHFEFPKVRRFSIVGVLPVEPRVRIDITAHGPNGPVLLLGVAKSDYFDGSELDGKPLNIVCRLDLEPEVYNGHWGTIIEVK